MNRRYGWKPDLPDIRDKSYRVAKPAALPSVVDLRPTCPPVVDQGQLGACTGNAIAGAIGYLEKWDGLTFDPVSRLFIYFNERTLEDTVDQDAGAQIRDGIKTVVAQGACSETDWPYDINQFTTQPPPQAYADAAKHKITAYARIQSPEDMKQCLAEGFPFVFGFTVYDSFESADVAATGVVPMPDPDTESVQGGHAVGCVGYDDTARCYIVRNSWGPDWGAAGYFYLPYDYLHNPNLASDMWTLRRGTGF